MAEARALIVVKLGGSLHADPLLRDWLRMLADAGRGQVVIVPGGGSFADEVRNSQAKWRFDDLTAHNMAVLAMMQSALLMKALAANLALAASPHAIMRALANDQVAVWLPANWLRRQADSMTNWGVTSDSLAASLAARLDASRLVLVKSCEIAPGLDLAAHAASGVVDAAFCRITSHARHPIDLLGKTELPRLRALLEAGAARSAIADAEPGASTGSPRSEARSSRTLAD